jgi:hypothetical protein
MVKENKMTKLSDPINHNGSVTTISALIDAGLIELRKSDKFHSRNGLRTAYFADIKGTTSGWEISKLAYLSRTGQKVEL